MIEIREIEKSELDELLMLYDHLHDSDDPLPAPSVVHAVWNGIKSDPHQKYFGAYMNGKLVASCVLVIVLNLTRGCRPYGIIENVVTHQDFRRQGIGKFLLNAALAYAWDCHCYKVMLLTGPRIDAVFSFYESVGFDKNAKQAFLAKPPRKS